MSIWIKLKRRNITNMKPNDKRQLNNIEKCWYILTFWPRDASLFFHSLDFHLNLLTIIAYEWDKRRCVCVWMKKQRQQQQQHHNAVAAEHINVDQQHHKIFILIIYCRELFTGIRINFPCICFVFGAPVRRFDLPARSFARCTFWLSDNKRSTTQAFS